MDNSVVTLYDSQMAKLPFFVLHCVCVYLVSTWCSRYISMVVASVPNTRSMQWAILAQFMREAHKISMFLTSPTSKVII